MDIREEIARVLNEHEIVDYTETRDEAMCACQWDRATGDGKWHKASWHKRHVIKKLAALVARIQAETLREAADEFYARLPDGTSNGRAYNSYTVARMLRARADRQENPT